MNLAAALLASAARDPGAPAVLAASGPITHGELAAATAALAARLTDPGTRVAIVAGNEPAFVVAYLATLAAGAVAVPLNPAAPVPELARELDVTRPARVLCSEAYVAHARAAVAAATIDATVDVITPDSLDAPGTLTPVSRATDDLAALLFTAGTAGAPKAAMLTHGCLLANLEQVQRHPGLALRADDVVLGVLPLFHVYGLNVVLGLALFAGACVSMVEHFHPRDTLRRIASDGVTVVPAVPAIYAAWTDLSPADAPPDAFASVRRAVSGAAALDPEVARAASARFGITVEDGYGLTEASPVVTTAGLGDVRPGSIGPPLPGVEVRLVDVDGADVLTGDPGELWVKGPNVFAGYWEDELATERVLTADGWLRTGDVAVADDDGWLTLVGRAKDVIIVSGFNVHPGEVEEVLLADPDVADAAVVGEPHPRTGETVVAYVVPASERGVDTRALLHTASTQLARYKLPSRVEVVASLPRNFAGKLVRRALAPDVATEKPA
ncbi:MAG TPA: AMP-binding protein [Acidimicrobiia bacterium]|nr:AMP-binding protein [Acidimicrobiia bacterium]